MATVSTETIYFNGAQYRLVYNVDAKGIFYLNIPVEMSERLVIERKQTADTLEKLKQIWKRLFKEYEAASTVTRKIIVYRMEVNAEIHNGVDDFLIKKDDISFAGGLALSFEAGVFNLHTTTTGNKVSESHEHVRSNIPSSASLTHLEYWEWKNGKYGYMDWTEEREKFFIDLIHAFENLILKLDGFLNTSAQEKLLKIIDQRLKLLPEGDK